MLAAVNAPMAVSEGANPSFEDYSIYSDLSDEELVQLAIDRSLTDVCSPRTCLPQDVRDKHRSSNSLTTAHRPAAPAHVYPPSFARGQNNDRAYRPAVLCTETAPRPASSPSEGQNETKNSSGERVKMLSWVKRNGMLEVALNDVDMPAEFSAIWVNDVQKLREILEEVPHEVLCQPSKEGWTYVHEAAHIGQEECLNLLIEALPQLLNKRTKKGETPLHLAVTKGHTSCVLCLLLAGADPNVTNNLGESALYRACEKNNLLSVELLLRFGAKVSMGSIEGVTPLHEAVRQNNLSICKLLLNAGANIRARTVYGIDPLFVAAQVGNTEPLDCLIKWRADIDCQAKDGATPLYEASKNGHVDAVKLLLSNNADVNRTTKAGLTPLHVASKKGHARIVSLLIPHTNKMIVKSSGISPLHLAAEHNRDEVLEILINAGFNVNTLLSYDSSQVYDDRCCTALHFTIRNSNIDAAYTLLEAGADPNVDIFNPLLVAVRKGNIPMVAMLVKYGANVNARVPTFPTAFPGALLFCMKQTPMLKLLLDYGCDANACFTCVYGSNQHPPMKRRRFTRDDLDLDISKDLHGIPTQFCEMIADPFYSKWAGPIIDRLLDYTGPVKLCSRVTEVLESNKDWVHIKDKTKPSFCLMHLCRQRIRQQVSQRMLREMTSLPLPRRLIDYLFYDDGESESAFSYFDDF